MTSVEYPERRVKVKHLIDGDWVEGDGDSQNVISPYFGRPIADFTSADSVLIDRCVNSAHVAQKKWQLVPLKERTQILFRFREILLRDSKEISQVVSLESGKTEAEAFAGLMKGIEVLEFALSVQNLDSGGQMMVSRGVSCHYRRKALGVVVSITPFNFPAMVPMWTIPNALVLGNSYIWKPSEKTPMTSTHLGNALMEAGLPNGVLSVLHGGKETVERLIEHPKVKGIAFVGSSKVAKRVYSLGAKNDKRVLALGGAKNHIVLLPDANRELSGVGISDSFTGCAGQRCMAASVLLAVGDVQGHIDKIVERAKSQQLGMQMGAIISQEQVQFLTKAISEAEQQGAKILLDGRKSIVPTQYSNGFWLGPTILDSVDVNSTAACEELFGPILSIVRCDSISQAMEIENKSEYGNACSVFTSSADMAERVLAQAEAGMLGVNIGVPVPREPFSFAGTGKSKFGHGEITGAASLDFWSDLQKVTTKWERQSDENWMS